MSLERQAEILEQVTGWVVQHGLHGLSLRPLAAGVGTSARMLVYHFGSKEQLISRVLGLVAERWMGGLQAELDAEVPLDVALERLWATLRDPSHRGVHVLALEAWVIGLSSGGEVYGPFLKAVAAGWVELVARCFEGRGVARRRAHVRATFLVAAMEGLLLHHLTDDALPVDEAFQELLSWLRRELEA